MELNILRADPAGNITVFVLDPVEKAQRAAIAEKIMAIPALKAEQVGYACTAEDNVDGHMEMMGGEFCGNATRAYGMYIAQQKGGLSSVRLRVSGCDHAVTAQVDLKSGTARAEMPCPRSVKRVTVNGHEGTLVDEIQAAYGVYDGIVINPAAYTHTSIAILDALKAVAIPAVEVHISDVDSREPFRQVSYAGMACVRTFAGLGFDGYVQAIRFLKGYVIE